MSSILGINLIVKMLEFKRLCQSPGYKLFFIESQSSNESSRQTLKKQSKPPYRATIVNYTVNNTNATVTFGRTRVYKRYVYKDYFSINRTNGHSVFITINFRNPGICISLIQGLNDLIDQTFCYFRFRHPINSDGVLAI